jgi:type I restriction enzyme, R subunit
MPTTDTSEKGLETLIVSALTGRTPHTPGAGSTAEPPVSYGGVGYVEGDPHDYDTAYCVDLAKLLAFLRETQPEITEQLQLHTDGPTRRKLLDRLQGDIAKRGVVAVLRRGVKHGPGRVDLFYGTPNPGNQKAQELFEANIFSVTRQLRYSADSKALGILDIVLFINGLPLLTFELKNRLTHQTVEDAVEQYKRDRDPREPLFRFGRCLAHFALDEEEVRFCPELKGKASWFLPFNKGWNDGAGNPPNPQGIKTDYLWRDALTRESLTDIIENYAQVVEDRDRRTGKTRRAQIFPRYHQLHAVRRLLGDACESGAGRRYLIQHSAGSGKSNSIAWLAHQLVGLERNSKPVFDSVVVVTDRVVLDNQLRQTIKQFTEVSATVGHADKAVDLRRFLSDGKKMIITTVQKFPFIVDEIRGQHAGRTFAILIDEAHSSQGGNLAGKMNAALADWEDKDEEPTPEDRINRAIEDRKMLPNASYFAFTATPKNKTLEIFGDAYTEDGEIKHRPFHVYTMKQATQEGFILDVLESYTPVESYYRLIKSVEDDPEFDAKKAQKKLRKYVEGHEHAVRQKAEIMADHFHEQVLARNKVGGAARAMVATGGIQRAIQYFHALSAYLKERKSPYAAIVAFSGEHSYNGEMVTEANVNGFPSNQIPEKFREEPYRFLVVADKFQTGYDEPLLHTMYVDKPLAGIKAVQTLSRLNRAHPKKHDTFVLDFQNNPEAIRTAFEPYYRTTILGEETDPNKLHDLKDALDSHEVYSEEQVHSFVDLYLEGADRDRLDPLLDTAVSLYVESLDEDDQVDFKGKAKAFVRTYSFLAAILPYSNADWERLSIFLNFLIPKLPAPKEEDLSQGILDVIDMDSYRVEAKSAITIALADEDAEIDSVPTGDASSRGDLDVERLSAILMQFNDQFGNIDWKDRDKIQRVVTQEIPAKVAADKAYQNAMQNSGRENARLEHDKALERAVTDLISDHTELFKLFSDNPSFRNWLSEMVFSETYVR